MENFENNWQKILNDTATDSAFRPDVERIWSHINHAQKPRKKITPWFTHLAAAVAGIVLAFAAMWFQLKPVAKKTVVVKRNASPTVIHDTITQTIVVNNNEAEEQVLQPHHATTSQTVALKKHPENTNKPKILNTTTSTNNIDEIKIVGTETLQNNTENSVQTASAKTVLVQPIHLVDIEQQTKNLRRESNQFNKMIASKFTESHYSKTPTLTDIFK